MSSVHCEMSAGTNDDFLVGYPDRAADRVRGPCVGRGSGLTASMTANIANNGEPPRASADGDRPASIYGGRRRMPADAKNAVFETVCGALMRERSAPLAHSVTRGNWAARLHLRKNT
jgi:hypothetical protein